MPLHALARAGLAVTLLLGLVGTAHALTLKSEEFKTHRRPAVTFDHDNHNERAKIEDWLRQRLPGTQIRLVVEVQSNSVKAK